MKKVSIIVPIYNSELYVKACIDSLVKQTYQNIEIILIDDGSTDNSLKICKQYNDSRIKIFTQENLGVANSRNKGMELATGDYLMFVDADDWIEENTIELIMHKISLNDDDILFYNFFKDYNNSEKKNRAYDENYNFKDHVILKKLKERIVAPFFKNKVVDESGLNYTWNKLIKREIIGDTKFHMTNLKAYGEDMLFILELLNKTNKIRFYNEYLYHYRIHNESATFKFNDDIMMVSEILSDKLNSFDINNQVIYSRIFYNLIKEMNLYIFNKKLNLSLKKRINLLKIECKKTYFKNAVEKLQTNNLNFYLKTYLILFKFKFYYLIYLVNRIEKIIRFFK
jgi:glycosyltransferase EpsH